MKLRLPTLVGLLGIVIAGLAWSGRPPVEVPVVAAQVQAEKVDQKAVADAATAMLAVAMIATGPPIHVRRPVDAFGMEIARIARGFLVRRPPGFRDDCSGFASSVYTQAGVPMDRDVWGLWERAGENNALTWGDPQVGDLVFFDDTTDRNRDGQWNDDLTHVGVVIDVEPDGTVKFAHAGLSVGRTIGSMNLEHPAEDRAADGHRLNSFLREPRPGDPPTANYLSGELWAGFAHVAPDSDWL